MVLPVSTSRSLGHADSMKRKPKRSVGGRPIGKANRQAWEDFNHGRSDQNPYDAPAQVSDGDGSLFNVVESNLDDGWRPSASVEVIDSNAIRITSANIVPMIMVALLAVAIVISFVGGVINSIENPEPDRPYRPPPVNTDPFHPCYGLTAFECKWN